MKNLATCSNPDSILGRSLVLVSCAAVLILAGCVFSQIASSAQLVGLEWQPVENCGSPEECFAAAVWPKERLGNILTKDQVQALKLERLRRVMDQFPDSLWAKRAG